MVSKLDIRTAIDAADREFRWCWDVFAAVKGSRIDGACGQSLLNFQVRLLNAISALERVYRTIKQEEKRLIRDKPTYAPSWFAKRMAKLNDYAKAINSALAVGRALGDAFAWTFYERDRDLITEHFKHQRQSLLPPGVGALGESFTLRKLQGFGGQLLIYHGTTTFLRMGDVSFIDLETLRVASVGEIKTQPVGDNRYEVSLHLVAGDPSQLPKIDGTKRDNPRKLSPDTKARLRRQVRQMEEAVVRSRTTSSAQPAGLHGKFHFDELRDLVARSHHRRFEFVKAGPSLVIGALRLRSATLGATLLGSGLSPDRVTMGTERWARELVDTKLDGNALYVGTLGGGRNDLALAPETFPLLWWPVPDDVLRDILFGAVMVITLYNPAHFWEELRSRGFQVAWDKQHQHPRVSRVSGKRTMKLENFEHFQRLITWSLMTQASVLEMVDQMLAAASEVPKAGSARIEMRHRLVRDPGLKT